MKQTIHAVARRLGAKLNATEPTGHLGCDPSRARPVGAVRARSDLLWANLTGYADEECCLNSKDLRWRGLIVVRRSPNKANTKWLIFKWFNGDKQEV